MLDPRTIRALSARPADNGRELNVAIAEEGDAHALVSLSRWVNVDAVVLDAIVTRVLSGAPIESGLADEDPPKIEIPWEPSDEPRPQRPWTLERALLSLVAMHPNAPARALTNIVSRHPDEPGFLLATALAPSAPEPLLDRVAAARARSALHDRPWIDLLAARHDARALSERWSESAQEPLREAAARLTHHEPTLDRLSRDASRRVRRAVALNPSATTARARLAIEDPAIEVRACAMHPPHPRGAPQASRALARSARSFERGGELDPRVVEAITTHADSLDPELAWLSGLVLDLDELRPVALALAEHDASHPSSRAILASTMVRPAESASPAQDAAARAELSSLLARAIVRSYVPSSSDAKGLTGHARLVAFLSELLADRTLVDDESLTEGLSHGALVGDPALASRWIPLREARQAGFTHRLAEALTRAAARGGRPGACALEAAWRDRSIELPELVKLARVVKPRREAGAHLRGRADGTRVAHVDLDLDPSLRAPGDLSRLVEALEPWVKLSMRAVLVFLAATPRALSVGGRDLRQFVANVPGETNGQGAVDGVVASQLQRILRAARGASEVETRVAKIDAHADEAGVAVALLAQTARAGDIVAILGRDHRLNDGVFLAAIVEALWALGRRDDVKALIDALGARRRDHAASLVAWLIVGELDRARSTSVFAGALDEPIASTAQGPHPAVCQALGIVERRAPGTLERLRASTRTGQALVVNALARAYPGLVGGR